MQSDLDGELDIDLKRNIVIVKNRIKLIKENLKQGIEMKERNDNLLAKEQVDLITENNNDKLVTKIQLCKADKMLRINTIMYDNCLNKLDSNDIGEIYDILQIDNNIETVKFLRDGFIRYKSIDTAIVRIGVTAVGNGVAGVSNYVEFNLCESMNCLTRTAYVITDGKLNVDLHSSVITIKQRIKYYLVVTHCVVTTIVMEV